MAAVADLVAAAVVVAISVVAAVVVAVSVALAVGSCSGAANLLQVVKFMKGLGHETVSSDNRFGVRYRDGAKVFGCGGFGW